MEKEKFLTWYPNNENAGIAYDSIQKGLQIMGIYSDLAFIGAMATARVEVGRDLKPICENTDGKYLEGRSDLGNTQKGDGYKYRGRGYLQLTGRYNYEFYGKMIGSDLINNPDYALEPTIAGYILAAFFKNYKCNELCNTLQWYKVRELINGRNKKTGLPNGICDFLKIIPQYMQIEIVE